MSPDEFSSLTGRDPEDDDLARVNCGKAGEVGHFDCGWCETHNKPRSECMCYKVYERGAKWPYGLFDRTWAMLAPSAEDEWFESNAEAMAFIQRAHDIWPGIEWAGYPDKSR